MTKRLAPLANSRALAVLCGLAVGLEASGCYQGEWRIGPEVPVATTSRLVPVREIERWDLQQTATPYVLQVRATSTQRCRYALRGNSRRTDTGKFKRVGGGFWTGLAISTGIVGGAGAGIGGAGWFSQLYPEWGRPVAYAAGGALAVGGLASCIAAISKGTKVRYALCGLLFGLGGSVIAGAALSALPGQTAQTPLVDTPTFQKVLFAGGGAIGAAVLSGIISGVWRGYIDRVRSIEIENAHVWDAQAGEQACGSPRPIVGRTATLDISLDAISEGQGSTAMPLQVRIAFSGQAAQPVDLRGLRQSVPSCGAMHIGLNPDIQYEPLIDNYEPPTDPDYMSAAARPIHGDISPRDGLTLQPFETRARSSAKKDQPILGISPDVLAAVEQHCRGDQPVAAPAPTKSTPPVRTPRETPSPAQSDDNTQAQESSQAPVRPSVDSSSQDGSGRTSSSSTSASPSSEPPARPGLPAIPTPTASSTPSSPSSPSTSASEDRSPPSSSNTPGLTPNRRPFGQRDDTECSPEASQARFSDCEHQCAKALEISACLFEFRKCHIEARFAPQSQREHEVCDLHWEQCLFKQQVGPGAWRRCVDGCQQANEPAGCRSPTPSR